MANDYRDRDWNRGRDRDFDRGEEGRNRGMFGYEGEGFLRGGDEDVRGGDRWRSERDDRGDFSRGFAGGYGTDRDRPPRDADHPRGGLVEPRGYRDLESGVSRSNDYDRPSFRGRGPKTYQRSKDRIREDVCERLAMDHHVDASDIEVTVSEGTVTLVGSVQDRRAKRRAEDLSESVHGVRDVQNQIRVARNESQY
jgi:osmotically-inducible protein OsmY